VHENVAGFLLRIGDAKLNAVSAHPSAVAYLPAGLGVEGRLVENDRAALTRL